MKAILLEFVGWLLICAAATGAVLLLPWRPEMPEDDADTEMEESSWRAEPDPCAPSDRAQQWFNKQAEQKLP